MGLDITAYETIELITTDEYTGPEDDSIAYLHPHESFPRHAEDIVGGVYRVSGERYEFRAGSYSGYSAWRDELAKLVGTTAEAVWQGQAPPAFGELINFADNEGLIGPKRSAKLAKDFTAWREKAALHAKALEPDMAEYFVGHYAHWEKAFTIAARGGAVDFH